MKPPANRKTHGSFGSGVLYRLGEGAGISDWGISCHSAYVAGFSRCGKADVLQASKVIFPGVLKKDWGPSKI